MKDLLPVDMARFRRVEDVFRQSCSRLAYQEVRTPTLEYLNCFTSTGTLTPRMLRSVYSFLDWDGWSGERVVLRPDGTIPVTRLFVEHFPDTTGVHKFFYVENVFRFTDSVEQARERWQCGAELLGSALPQADAELVVLALEVLERLCLEPVTVQISHAGILRHLLEKLDLGPDDQGKIFDEIQEGDLQALAVAEREHPRVGRFLPLLLEANGKSSGLLKNLKASLVTEFPGLASGFDNFIQLAELLTGLECPYEINFGLPGGFEYYTGFMFQLSLNGEKVGGGGRYDELLPLVGGPSMASSGFALYMDRLMAALSSNTVRAASTPRRVLVRPPAPSPEALAVCFRLASRLHEEGITAEVDLGQHTGGFTHLLTASNGGLSGSYEVVETASGKTHQVPAGKVETVVNIVGTPA